MKGWKILLTKIFLLSAKTISVTVISFFVNVPVLSEHIIVAHPKIKYNFCITKVAVVKLNIRERKKIFCFNIPNF